MRPPTEKVGAVMPRKIERPEPRKAPERRRAGGGGVARVAFGAIAVSVVAGAAVAAFNYEPGQQNTVAAPEPTNAVAINVAPNAMPGPAPGTVTDAAPDTASLTGVQVASAEPLPAPLANAETSATVQSARGWTASLPTMPAAPKATQVSATSSAPATARPARPASAKLTPIDAPLPSTGIVAVDNANLGAGTPVNTLANAPPRPRTPEEERAWIRKQATYGPE
jgi:hypothetical protein